jgi:hypothetical protein
MLASMLPSCSRLFVRSVSSLPNPKDVGCAVASSVLERKKFERCFSVLSCDG